ncbi:hypothetical protein GQ53DRAFT_548801 [Thozetella sp. PMI_491]|nr:hypothetical protein GQ53DRAFT_548801 [Thozetella sp. PMI_491]
MWGVGWRRFRPVATPALSIDEISYLSTLSRLPACLAASPPAAQEPSVSESQPCAGAMCPGVVVEYFPGCQPCPDPGGSPLPHRASDDESRNAESFTRIENHNMVRR